MDSSAFRHLPVGKIMVFAIIGWVVTILGGSIGLIVGGLWLLNHVRIV